MTVCVPYSPLFEYPDIKSQQIDQVLFGENAEIIDQIQNFYRIKTYYGYVGFIKQESVTDLHYSPNMEVCVNFADLLLTAKYFFTPVMTLPRGSKVDVGFSHLSEFERYGFVLLPDKKIYYIHRNHISPIKKQATRQNIIDTAKNYIGTQYRWGGRTAEGIDCSGLAFNAYLFNDIIIYRDSDFTKHTNIKSITLSQAKPADLVFFKGHVAIYLGENKIIHSTASFGGVYIADLDEEMTKNILFIGTFFDD